MNNIQKRFLLFLCGCMLIRFLLVILSKNVNEDKLQYLGYLALIPVIGWLYIIFIGNRDTGGEVFGEKIWWKDLRIVHTSLWSIFAYMAINKNNNAWLILLIDTIFGLVAFLNYHIMQGNYKYLF